MSDPRGTEADITDPRITRTRDNAFGALREILGTTPGQAPTFSVISRISGIARKTLYAHWDTPARMVGDFLLAHHTDPVRSADVATDPLLAFVTDVRDSFRDPVVTAALAHLIDAAVGDPAAADALVALSLARAGHLAERVGGEPDPERLAALVGPIFFTRFVLGSDMSDAALAALVERHR